MLVDAGGVDGERRKPRHERAVVVDVAERERRRGPRVAVDVAEVLESERRRRLRVNGVGEVLGRERRKPSSATARSISPYAPVSPSWDWASGPVIARPPSVPVEYPPTERPPFSWL